MGQKKRNQSAKIERRSILGFDRPDSVSENGADPTETTEEESSIPETQAEDVLKKERDEYYDLLLRKQAEFENYRKRVLREREETRINARADVIAELLPVVDACEKGLEAMQSKSVPEPCRVFVDGYELLLKQLRSFLEKHEVKEVPGVGSDFDPNIHEAVVSEIADDQNREQVIEEFRKGYLIGERLLRPSQVKVAIPASDSSSGDR